jgi:tetratricopeptide (TPR) repeat protein
VGLWRALKRLSIPGAWLAALIFAIHPINVQSVAWITERKNTLSLFLFGLSLLAYLRFDEQGSAGSGPWSLVRGAWSKGQHSSHPTPAIRYGWYWFSLVAFVLALLSKTSVVMLPFILLARAWWRRGRLRREDWLHALPFFGVALALALVTIWFQYERSIGTEVVAAPGFAARLIGAGMASWFYLARTLFPRHPAFVYPRWNFSPGEVADYIPGLVMLGIWLVFWLFRNRWGRPFFFALSYFLVMLFPVLGFFKIYFQRYSLVADHWAYPAMIGIIALVVGGGAALVQSVTRRAAPLQQSDRRRKPAKPDEAAHPKLSVLSHNYVCIAMPKRQRTVQNAGAPPNAPDSAKRFGVRLSSAAFDSARKVRAILRRYTNGQLWPALGITNVVGVLAGIALVSVLAPLTWAQCGIYQNEETLWRATLKRNPACWLAHHDLASLLVAQCKDELSAGAGAGGYQGLSPAIRNKLNEALFHELQAISWKPDHAGAHYGAGHILSLQNQIEDAIPHFRRAIELQPEMLPAIDSLVWILAAHEKASVRNGPEAVRLAQRAVALTGSADPRSLQALAVATAEAGDFPAAIDAARKALKLAEGAGDRDLARELSLQLRLFQEGHPLHNR